MMQQQGSSADLAQLQSTMQAIELACSSIQVSFFFFLSLFYSFIFSDWLLQGRCFYWTGFNFMWLKWVADYVADAYESGSRRSNYPVAKSVAPAIQGMPIHSWYVSWLQLEVLTAWKYSMSCWFWKHKIILFWFRKWVKLLIHAKTDCRLSENSQVANARFQAAAAIRDAAIREWGFLTSDDKKSLIRYLSTLKVCMGINTSIGINRKRIKAKFTNT